jgi:hypothetical protein
LTEGVKLFIIRIALRANVICSLARASESSSVVAGGDSSFRLC